MLKGKKILIGVTAGIAAYKMATTIRLLKKLGAEVQVIMTPSAFDFITPLTLSALSENPVISEFKKDKTGEWNHHVKLGLWADLFLIAPLTANTLAKLANGICDNFLLATYLSARCQVMVAPAMDLDMYQHPTTVRNINQITEDGIKIIDAEEGELASGLVGKGRMAEPQNIVYAIQDFFTPKTVLKGKKILLTAGPTQEAVDPVRYITNHSTGKMGYSIAHEMAKRGAEVFLVSGKSQEIVKHPNITLYSVKSAQEMYEKCAELHNEVEIVVFSAAVADYTPKVTADKKLKKKDDDLSIELKRTVDIAKTLGQQKSSNQFHIGFALETDNEEFNAKRKLESKNFDLIVLNSLRDKGAGFAHQTNKVSIISSLEKKDYPLKSKEEVAIDIIFEIENLFA